MLYFRASSAYLFCVSFDQIQKTVAIYCFSVIVTYNTNQHANHSMSNDWHSNAPIYRQLKERIVTMLLDGTLQTGDTLPSVRQIAADFQLNPITVSRAYQELVDEGLVETKRGLGMFVLEGARDKLLDSERNRFLNQEWPAVVDRMNQLGLNATELLKAIKKGKV